MRLEERRTLQVIAVVVGLGALGAVLVLPGMFAFGWWMAPPMPHADRTQVPPLIRDALWARAEGGRATELRPINPFNVAQHVFCNEMASQEDDPQQRAQHLSECEKYLPAMRGVEYLSNMHMRDNRLESNFRTGASRFATTIWLTHRFTKEDFLNTLATRGDFGFGWRGVEAAARGYFDRQPADLDLSQAAFLASRVGDLGIDPWCAPVGTKTRRDRVLTTMRNNGAIDEDALHAAQAVPLGLISAPADHRCSE